jgi:hypothetical protein
MQVVAQQQLAYNLSETPIISDGARRFIDLAVSVGELKVLNVSV